MPTLDPQLQNLLSALRGRIRQYLVLDSLLVFAVIVLTAFWLGLALDYLPVKLGGSEMPRSARTVLALAVAIGLSLTAWRLLIRPLMARLRDDSLALLIERHHPQLGGRLVTAVQLQQPGRRGDGHAAALLEQVHREAVQAAAASDLKRVFRWEPIRRKAWLVTPLAVVTLLFAAWSPSAFAHAAKRLLLLSDQPWPRLASLELVGVELPLVTLGDEAPGDSQLVPFEDRLARLPRGSSGTLRLLAKADGGAVVPEVCTLFFRSESGVRGQANLRRVGRVTDGYQAFVLDGAPLAGISESVQFSIQGLDARLDGYRLEAVAPPALDRLQITTTDPDYLLAASGSDQPSVRHVDYQAGLRIREGSSAVLTARSSVPLGRVTARLLTAGTAANSAVPASPAATANDPAAATAADVASVPQVHLSDDGLELQLTIDDIRQPTTVLLIPEDRQAISAQLPYRYQLGVVQDEKPQMELRLRGIGTAVTRIARLPLHGSVRDDYAIDQAFATLTVLPHESPDLAAGSNDAAAPSEENHSVRHSYNQPLTPDREGRFEITIDLRSLAEDRQSGLEIPETGSALNLLGEASDHYDLDGRVHRVTSDLFQLNIVTADQLLAILERRELSLRGRLEQTIEEAHQLRDNLDELRSDLAAAAAHQAAARQAAAHQATGDATAGNDASVATDATTGGDNHETAAAQPAADPDNETLARGRQLQRLRSQQMALQATKTSEELTGMAVSLDELLEEMVNNRVDSVDRSQRIGQGVRDPLRRIVAGDLQRLQEQLAAIEQRLGQPVQPVQPAATADELAQAAAAVATADQVLLQLNAVLEKMLDLESFNELLDIVRDLIEMQDGLIDQAQQEQKARVLDLFQ